MTSEHRITRRQQDSVTQQDQLFTRAGGFLKSLKTMTDQATAGKQAVLDSIAAKDGVHSQAFLDEVNASLDTVRVQAQELLDKIDAARNL